MIMQPNHNEILKELLTASQIAEKYSIDKSTVFKIAKRCKVTAMDFAGRKLFTKQQAKIISKNYYGEVGNPNFKKTV